MTKPISSSGVSISRECVSTIIRRQAARIHEQHERGKQRQREIDSVYKYDDVECVVCLVKYAGCGKYTATTVVEIGRAGLVTCRPDDERFLESSMRMAMAHAYTNIGVCKNFAEARERVKTMRFIMERAAAFGSAKNGGVSA